MKIYVAHSSSFNYMEDLYEPLERMFGSAHELILPHNKSTEQFSSKELFSNKGCDVIVAEVTLPSIGLGIELGWADMHKIPIICINKEDTSPSPSLKMISSRFIQYKDISDIQIELSALLDEL